MRAIVSGQISFLASDCHPKVIEQLWHDLSFPNPEYVSRQRMGRASYGIPETIVIQRNVPGNQVLLEGIEQTITL